MKRNLKALGLALAAVFAMSAVAASSASAHWVLTPGASPAILTGEQIPKEGDNVFTITEANATTKCNKAKFEGTVEGTEVTKEVTISAKYEECKSVIGGTEIEAVVDMNGCDYLLTGETGSEGHGLVHVKCPTGKVIEITNPSVNCTIKVHEQTPTSGGIVYENTETNHPDDIDATVTVKGVTFERSGGILCAASGIPSEGNNADLLQRITIRAYKDNNKVEGEQVNLTVS